MIHFEDQNEISCVEFAVKIAVAKPGVLQPSDPKLSVVIVHPSVTIQIEVALTSALNNRPRQRVDIFGTNDAVTVDVGT